MSLTEDIAAQWRHAIFVCYVMAMLVLFLLPVPETPLGEFEHIDKLVHFGSFFGFAVVFHVDYQAKLQRTLLVSVAFAGTIEVIQWLLPFREAEWWDFVASAAGALTMVVLVIMFRGRALCVR